VGISTSHYPPPQLTLCTTQCASSAGELDASRDNLKVAKEILALRVQQATMHGYANYAEYATADTMAGKPAKVMELLEVSGAEGCVLLYSCCKMCSDIRDVILCIGGWWWGIWM
jgi:hypothetical protein